MYEVVLIPTKIYLINNLQEIQRAAIHYTTVIQSVKSRLRNCRSMTQFLQQERVCECEREVAGGGGWGLEIKRNIKGTSANCNMWTLLGS